MERPTSFSSEDIRDEKVKVLRSIPPILSSEAILGQYVATTLSNGEKKPGYLDDDTVPKGSICPTFAGVVLHIENKRWEGVPFIFKAGKGTLCRLRTGFFFSSGSIADIRLRMVIVTALDQQKTEIRIQYKAVPTGIFAEITRNELVIRVQPGLLLLIFFCASNVFFLTPVFVYD